MRLLVVLCAGCVWAEAQQPVAAEAAQLSQIREHMMSNLAHLPDYTCVEMVERTQRKRGARKFQPLDRLRLEVAVVDGREMFGWPGARNFEETDPRNLVAEGAIGNGNFALHARAIIGGLNAKF